MSPQPPKKAVGCRLSAVSGKPRAESRKRKARLTIAVLAAAALTGCALTPKGADAERAKLHAQADRYEPPIEQRELPELPAEPTWQDVLHRAFLANGDLEAAYFQWKAKFERIDIASSWPNSNVSLGFDYMFSSENMKSFDRATFTLGFDASENLSLPQKTQKAGEIALHEAQAAGERFRTAKFNLQREALTQWAQLVLASQRLGLAQRNLTLVKIDRGVADGRVAAGGAQEDILKTELTAARVEDRVDTLKSDLIAAKARLNALLDRDPAASLNAPASLPPARDVLATDDQLLAAGAQSNPELAALAHEVEGRADALELARLQWWPDISPALSITGTASQAIGAMITLPTTIAEIRGSIREAEALQRESQAMLRQAQSNRAGEYVATLIALRNAERRTRLFHRTILPTAEHLAANAEQCCIAGTTPLSDLLEARQIVYEIREQIAESWAEREIQLADLEALAGIDFETLAATQQAALKEASRD